MSYLSLFQCAIRMIVSCALFWKIGVTVLTYPDSPPLTLIAIAGLVATFSVWLLFGVHTRVATTAALGLWLGWELLGNPVPQLEAETLMLALAGLPLIVFGGGAASLYPRGWSDLV